MPRYFTLRDGERLGPFTSEEIRQLVADGALDRGVQLEEEGSGLRVSLVDAIRDLPSVREETAAAIAIAPIAPDVPLRAKTAESLPRPSRPVLIYTAILVLLSLYLLIKRGWFFLDYATLIIHEAGHLIFGFFGEFIQFLGGTLMQLLFPALVAVHFFRRREIYGTQFALFWIGTSCLNISTYAADARAQQLELVGGGEHDWHYILGRLGLLEHDQAVAACFIALAAFAFLAIAAMPFLASMRFGPVEADK